MRPAAYWSQLPHRPRLRRPERHPDHAVANGVVTSAGYDGAYGNQTVVTLEDGTEIWYCHQTSHRRLRRRQRRRRPGRSATSAPPATPPARTCTSRSAPAAATRSTRTRAPGRSARAAALDDPRLDEPAERSELLDRRVAQQQPLDAVGAEVDRRDRLLRLPLDATRRCRARSVSWVTRSPGSSTGIGAGGLGLRGGVGTGGGRGEVAAAGSGRGAEPVPPIATSRCRSRRSGATSGSGRPRCGASRPGRPAARRGTATAGLWAGAPQADRTIARET